MKEKIEIVWNLGDKLCHKKRTSIVHITQSSDQQKWFSFILENDIFA